MRGLLLGGHLGAQALLGVGAPVFAVESDKY
jgi:hypothetical protein